MGYFKDGLYIFGDDVYQVLENSDGTISMVPTPETERRWRRDND